MTQPSPDYPPQPWIPPGGSSGPGPARRSRLPWVLGGGAVLAALLCLAGAVVLSAWLFVSGPDDTADPAPLAETAAATGAGSPAPPQPEIGQWPELAALPASAEPLRRSSGNGPATQVAFFNDRAEPVTISWLGPDGRRVRYQVLGPGETYTQQTYVGHPWVASTGDGTAVAVFEPAVQPARAVIR